MQEKVVSVRGLHTRFGSNVVHHDVDMELRRGEVLAIIGGSGSGKSVLLREILGLVAPWKGTVELFGQDLSSLSEQGIMPLRKRIGVLFQHAALFSSQTLLDNVAFPLREHTDLDEDCIEDLARLKVRLVGLPPEACARYPSELSGGMRKRAGLARALALDPEVLFLDEPTSGLDPVGANGLDELIHELAETLGLTVLMVTHDLASLFSITERVVMLGDRRIIAEGRPEEVAAVEHPVVEAFFGGSRGEAARTYAGHAREDHG